MLGKIRMSQGLSVLYTSLMALLFPILILSWLEVNNEHSGMRGVVLLLLHPVNRSVIIIFVWSDPNFESQALPITKTKLLCTRRTWTCLGLIKIYWENVDPSLILTLQLHFVTDIKFRYFVRNLN